MVEVASKKTADMADGELESLMQAGIRPMHVTIEREHVAHTEVEVAFGEGALGMLTQKDGREKQPELLVMQRERMFLP